MIKNKFKKNDKYTDEFENYIVYSFIEMYRNSKTIDEKNEIIQFLKDGYNKYFSYKFNRLGLEKEDIETYMYLLIKDGLEKYDKNLGMSFKSYIITRENYLIKTTTTKFKQLLENQENGKIINVFNFSDLSNNNNIESENYEEDFYDINNTDSYQDIGKEISDKLIIEEITDFIKNDMGKRGELFYNRVFNNIKLEDLGKQYGMSNERVRQIVENVRVELKEKYSYLFKDGKILL